MIEIQEARTLAFIVYNDGVRGTLRPIEEARSIARESILYKTTFQAAYIISCRLK